MKVSVLAPVSVLYIIDSFYLVQELLSIGLVEIPVGLLNMMVDLWKKSYFILMKALILLKHRIF